MALFGDLTELKEQWKNASLLKKIIIVLLFFIATGSLASLSDVFFKWKGFVLDGIEFYQQYISIPIHTIVSKLIEIPHQDAIDYLIFMTIASVAFLRFAFYELNFKRINRHEWFYVSMVLIAPVLWMIQSIQKITNELFKPNLSYFYLPFLIMLSLSFAAWFTRTKRNHTFTHLLLIIWMPVIICVTVVLIIAAVNSGLTRTA